MRCKTSGVELSKLSRAKIDALEEEHGSNLENKAEIDRLKQLKKNL